MSDRDLVSFNLAARAARWSAGHWKTTLFGWIAFCVVAVALGSVAGTRMLKDADTAAGETKTAETMLRDAGFPSRAGESVLVESGKGGDAFRPAVPGRGDGRRPDGLGAAERAERPLPARPWERRPGLERPPLGARPVRDRAATPTRPRTRSSRSWTRSGRCRPPRRLHRRRDRQRERELRARQDPQQGLPRAEYSTLPITLDHPAGRVRRARRGRVAGLARVLGRARFARALSGS